MTQRLARRFLSSTAPACRKNKQRRAMFFESLEGRSLLATITGNTAIGGFEALNSSSLLYQLNASSLPLANGNPVTAWNNSGAAANNFTQGNVDKQPTYVASGTLGNNLPTVSFDGAPGGQTGNPIVAPFADELILPTSTSPASIFIVNSTATSNGTDGIIGQELGDFGIRRASSGAWFSPGNANDFTNPGSLYINGATGTNPAAALNQAVIMSAMRGSPGTFATTSIGDYFQAGLNPARMWGGQIGDVLAFNRALSATEQKIIENSLSAKYGIALAAGDIYAGDNNVLGDYDRGVIGIGGQSVTNVALGKTATLSNQGHPTGDAAHGTDGNTNGNYGSNSVTHSDTNTNPFLNVNLGDSFTITSVDLWNRTDCCGDRMRDIRVQILDATGTLIWQNPTLINPGNVLGSPTRITVDVVALNGGSPVNGNQVRVVLEGTGEIINIAEVQVWATQQYNNVAQGKTAIQSSLAAGGTPDRAVDGNTNGAFGGNSVTHTNSEANPSWRVDLGSDTPINQILLYNRTDCCGDRLSDVTVEILNSSLTPVFTATGLNAANVLDNPYLLGVDVKLANGGTPVTGRYVRVTAVGASKILSLAEVMVQTAPVATTAAVGSAGSNGFGIELSSGAGLNNYLTAGYKQVANSLVNTDLPAGVDSRWDRAWYVDKTGTMNATMAFDFSDSGLAAPPASTLSYQLLYSPNNNFESANSSFAKLNITPTVVGDLVTFAVPDGQLLDGYYTLGLLDQAATLQPGSASIDGAADAWRLVRSGGGANLDFYQGATLVRSTPYASITSVTVTGSGDNDTLTVDQSGGLIAKPISYNGGGQTSTPGDSLVVTGGAATTITHTFINNNDGSVNIDGSVISYQGLEPITDNMSVVNRIFTFTGGAETIAITNVGGSDGITRIDSTLGEFVDFSVPSTSLTINTNGGDTTNITAFDPAFNTPTITLADASGTTSTVNLGASNVMPDVSALVLTGNVNFNLNGFSDQIASLASTNATPSVTLSAGQTLTTGNATNTAYTGTVTGSGTLVKVGTGIFTLAGGGATTNTANGLLQVDAGTLLLGAGFNGDGAWQGNITINNTGTLQYAQNNIANNSTDFTINTGGTLNMAGFSDAIGNLQGTGGAIINNAGITLDDLSGTRTYNGTIAGGGLTLRGAVDATGTQVLAGTSYAFSGVVVGRGTLTFNNTPTVTVSGTFATGDTNGAGVGSGAITGITNINGGTFTIGHMELGNRQSGSATVAATLNHTAGTVTVNGGAVDAANIRVGHWPGSNANYNLSGAGILNVATAVGTAVDGNGTFTQTGGTLNAPTVIVNLRNATGTGTFTFNGGTANIGAGGITTTGTPGTNSFLNLGGGTIRATATFSSSHAAVLTNAVGPAVFDTNTFNITMSGLLSGAGALIKNSAGTLILSNNANSFSGAVTVNGGALEVGDIADGGSNSGLGSGTPITLNGGFLRYNAAATDSSNRPITLGASHGGIDVSNAAGNITYSGGVTGGTHFTKIGAGQLTLSANATVNNLYISGGQLTLAGSGTVSVAGTILPGAAVADGALATGNGTLNVQGSVVVNTGAISINNQSSTIGTINQSGTSDVNVAGGFRIGHWPGGTGTYNISGGTLDVTGNPVGVVNPAGVGEQNGVIYLGVDGTGVMQISGTGAVTATGVVLDGRGNTAGTDTLTINGGSLRLGNNTNATTIAGSGIFTGNLNANPSYVINLGGGGTLRSITPFSTPLAMNLTGTGANAINVDTNGVNLTFTGVLSGAGGLAKVGAGNLLLTNTNTYADVTNVNSGTLQLQNGAAISNTAGAVSVAQGATLQLLNNETVSSYNGAGDLVGTNDSLLALGANTLTTTGNAAIANVTTAAGAGIIAGGSITDTDDDNNITGPNVYLQAATGIGTAGDAIETAVSNIQLNNSTSGAVSVLNSNAGALLTISDLRALGFGAQNLGGALTVVNNGPLTAAANVTASGAIVLTATDSGAVGENLAVNTSVTVQSTGSTVTLNAGDVANIAAGSRLAAAGTVAINIDTGADAGAGGVLNFAGDVDATLAIFSGVGDTVGDDFNVRPDQDVGDTLTPIQVFGSSPTTGVFPAGDGLTLDINGLGIPTLTLGPGARNGSFSFGGLAAPLTYNDIETVDTDPPGSTFHVVLDMQYAGYQNGVADTILMQLDGTGTNLLLDVNGAPVLNGPASDIQSLTIIGSSDNDALTIQETGGGLPRFLGAAPAVDNTGIGGGVSNGSHLNSSADLTLETLRPGQTPWDANDVTIHFDGGAAGNDSLTVNYTTLNNTGYFSDTSDSGNSGNVLAAPGAFPAIGAPALLISVANLEPLTLSTTAGGAVLVDATGTAATSTVTVSDIGAQTQIVADGGVATTTFSGFTSAAVVSGGGAESIDVLGVDNATLTSLTVIAGNTNDLLGLAGGDNSADTIRLRTLPSTTSALLQGNAGSDSFQLYDGSNTVDNITGPVVVDGSDGSLVGNTDTLTILDTGDITGLDTVVIAAVNAGASQDYFIDGITSTVSSDVVFRNIDVLDYTATNFADSIDGRFVNTTPPHDLSTVNLSGWLGGDQFLLFTSDQLGGSGGGFTPSGVASGVANINLFGDAAGNPNAGDGIDTFGASPVGIFGTGATNVGLVVPDSTRMIRPSVSTSIAIDGGQPTGLAAPLGDATGDINNIDISALPNTNSVIVSTYGPGTVVATGIQPLTWTQIEDINLVDQGKLTNVQMGDLFARTTPAQDLVQLTLNPTQANPNQVRLRITATIGNYSASNKTIIYGGGQNDTITQSNLTIPAEFYGEGGDDVLAGAMNNDWLVGGIGNDRINGSGGDNIIWGDNSPTNPGDLTPQDSPTGGDDQLSGLGGNDVFYGSGGNDLVSGGGGSDYANGGFGDDTLDGHDGDDRLYGGPGRDIVSGHSGNDLLSGGSQDDQLYGDSGNDVLFGGTGADLIDGGSGADLLVSGSVANENSSWTSVPNTTTFSAATYTLGSDNDAALLTLLAQWANTNSSAGIGAITHDSVKDTLFGSTGDDDFCWESADIADLFPRTTPSDYLEPGMGADQRFGPT